MSLSPVQVWEEAQNLLRAADAAAPGDPGTAVTILLTALAKRSAAVAMMGGDLDVLAASHARAIREIAAGILSDTRRNAH